MAFLNDLGEKEALKKRLLALKRKEEKIKARVLSADWAEKVPLSVVRSPPPVQPPIVKSRSTPTFVETQDLFDSPVFCENRFLINHESEKETTQSDRRGNHASYSKQQEKASSEIDEVADTAQVIPPTQASIRGRKSRSKASKFPTTKPKPRSKAKFIDGLDLNSIITLDVFESVSLSVGDVSSPSGNVASPVGSGRRSLRLAGKATTPRSAPLFLGSSSTGRGQKRSLSEGKEYEDTVKKQRKDVTRMFEKLERRSESEQQEFDTVIKNFGDVLLMESREPGKKTCNHSDLKGDGESSIMKSASYTESDRLIFVEAEPVTFELSGNLNSASISENKPNNRECYFNKTDTLNVLKKQNSQGFSDSDSAPDGPFIRRRTLKRSSTKSLFEASSNQTTVSRSEFKLSSPSKDLSSRKECDTTSNIFPDKEDSQISTFGPTNETLLLCNTQENVLCHDTSVMDNVDLGSSVSSGDSVGFVLGINSLPPTKQTVLSQRKHYLDTKNFIELKEKEYESTLPLKAKVDKVRFGLGFAFISLGHELWIFGGKNKQICLPKSFRKIVDLRMFSSSMSGDIIVFIVSENENSNFCWSVWTLVVAKLLNIVPLTMSSKLGSFTGNCDDIILASDPSKPLIFFGINEEISKLARLDLDDVEPCVQSFSDHCIRKNVKIISLALVQNMNICVVGLLRESTSKERLRTCFGHIWDGQTGEILVNFLHPLGLEAPISNKSNEQMLFVRQELSGILFYCFTKCQNDRGVPVPYVIAQNPFNNVSISLLKFQEPTLIDKCKHLHITDCSIGKRLLCLSYNNNQSCIWRIDDGSVVGEFFTNENRTGIFSSLDENNNLLLCDSFSGNCKFKFWRTFEEFL